MYEKAWNLLRVSMFLLYFLFIYSKLWCKLHLSIVLLVFWWLRVQGADGILVPGGFGDRGVEGKILAAKYARENNIPYLGICLGMQIAVIEFARSLLNLQDANSTEFDPDTRNPCVIFMPEVDKSQLANVILFFSVSSDCTYQYRA